MSKKTMFCTTRDLTTKGGTFIPAGSSVKVSYDGKTTRARLVVEGTEKSFVAEVKSLGNILEGYPKLPSIARLSKMMDAGVCPTPTGHRVEPDGFGPDGSPSWLLAAWCI